MRILLLNLWGCAKIAAFYRLFINFTLLDQKLMELGLESNVRHVMQRQMQCMQLCDQECEASVSRTNALIAQTILLLQTRGAELVSATRSCYSQAKSFHSNLHSRAAAVLAQLHSPPMHSHTASESITDAGAILLKLMDDARAAPLCVGCGGCGVSVDLSNVNKAISDLQVMHLRTFIFDSGLVLTTQVGGYQRGKSSDASDG